MPRRLDKSIAKPFLVLLAWLIFLVFLFPPLDRHLFSLSRFLVALIVGLLFISKERKHLPFAFTLTLFVLAFVESFFVLTRYNAMNNFSGYVSGNPNYSASLIAMGLIVFPFVLKKIATPRQPPCDQISSKYAFDPVKLLILLVLPLFASFILCASRGATIALALVLLYYLTQGETRQYSLLLIGTSLLLTILSFDKFISFWRLEWGPDQISGRIIIWKTALRAMLHNPILWVGFGSFEQPYLLYNYSVT